MREVVIAPKVEESIDRKPVEIKVSDSAVEDGDNPGFRVLTALIPKDAVIARAAGVFTDKYAPNGLLARTAFDFLEAALTADSWSYCMERLRDRDDDFDTEHITGIFEALFEEFTAQVDAEPQNREARRAAAKSAPRRR